MLEKGQKIKVKENLVVDNFYGGGRLHNGMAKHRGNIGEILGTKHYDNTKYAISIDCEGYDWTAEMFFVINK